MLNSKSVSTNGFYLLRSWIEEEREREREIRSSLYNYLKLLLGIKIFIFFLFNYVITLFCRTILLTRWMLSYFTVQRYNNPDILRKNIFTKKTFVLNLKLLLYCNALEKKPLYPTDYSTIFFFYLWYHLYLRNFYFLAPTQFPLSCLKQRLVKIDIMCIRIETMIVSDCSKRLDFSLETFWCFDVAFIIYSSNKIRDFNNDVCSYRHAV